MNERIPDPVPVGQFLGGELEARGWTQSDFAAVLGRPVQFVSEIVTGKKEITRESAAQIGAALGHTPEFWLRFQDQYLLSEQEKSSRSQRELSDVRRRAALNNKVPIAILKKRGVLVGKSPAELEAEVLELLELDSIEDEPAFQISARRSNTDEPVSLVQTAWVACVRHEARQRTAVARYSKAKLAALAAELPTRLTTSGSFRGLPSLFAAVGVILVYVEALPGAKIDGCAFMLGKTPVIALSGRGKRLDKVLWTLLHEVAHVLLGHISAEVVVEALDDTDVTDLDDTEVAADERARNLLLPERLPSSPLRPNAGWVNAVAAARGLAPIVIVGQLQNQGILDWRTTLARDAPTVTGELASW